MKKLIENFFGIKIMKQKDFEQTKHIVGEVAALYKSEANQQNHYHNWDATAEFRLTDLSLICAAENILNS